MAVGPSMPPDEDLDRTPVVASPQELASGSDHEDAGFDLGQRLGRYRLQRRLGEGGMGVVYEACDEELDRPVAIKVLWPGTGSARRAARLRGEAQVMARLNHPSIVKVFDVGMQDDQVWLAMELIEGGNLKQWLRATDRRVDEVLATMVRAGEGLLAAHEAGVVHRDFKPTNVLVADDGRVLVSDFGLARLAKEMSDSSGAQTGHGVPVADEGTVDTAGTPSYMAPEQHAGGPIDPRADQYAFCVTLWEALAGERPFAGATAGALLAQKRAKRLRRPPKAAMPRRVTGACLRGLCPDADGRWPTMRPLLQTLRPKTGSSALIVAGALGCAAALVASSLLSDDEPAPCTLDRQKISQTWNDSARQRANAALRATGLPYAPQTAASAAEGVDRYVARWLDLHRQTCGSDAPRDDMAALRLECLHQRRDELAALVEVLANADEEVAERAVASVAELTPVSSCHEPLDPSDGRGLGTHEEERLAVQRALDRADTMERTGQLETGTEIASGALATAQDRNWPALQARALLSLGTLQRADGKAHDARNTLADAFSVAVELGHDIIAARAAIALVSLVGFDLAEIDEGLQWARHAAAAAQRAGDPPRLEAMLAMSEANVLRNAARWDEARARLERARTIREQTDGPDSIGFAAVLNNLASLEMSVGNFDLAEQHHQRALAIEEGLLGKQHPAVAITLSGLGAAAYQQGHYEEAQKWLQRAAALRQETLGEEHPLLAATLNNLGITMQRLGDADQAREIHERALRIRERSLEPDHPDIAESLNNLGVVEQEREAWDRAQPYYERALAILEARLGATHPRLGPIVANLGLVLRGQGRHVAARVYFERAKQIYREAHGPDHGTVAVATVRLADVDLALGRVDAAVEALRWALPRLTDTPRERFARADAHFAMARGRALQGAPPSELQDLVQAAVAGYEAVGKAADRERSQARQWLRSQRDAARRGGR